MSPPLFQDTPHMGMYVSTWGKPPSEEMFPVAFHRNLADKGKYRRNTHNQSVVPSGPHGGCLVPVHALKGYQGRGYTFGIQHWRVSKPVI